MNNYLLDPEVCTSSLNENDEPVDPSETGHKYDLETGECSECGSLLTKKAKIDLLGKAMTTNVRSEDAEGVETYYVFTDDCPKALKNIFLEHYDINDVDYEIFDRAIDLVKEVFDEPGNTVTGDSDEERNDQLSDAIYERSPDSASPYTAKRLGYLTIRNEEEISQIMREYSEPSIATACAIWYDKQVEEAAILIKDWINA